MHTKPTPMHLPKHDTIASEIALMQCFCKLLEWRVNATCITCQTVCKALMYKFLHEYTFPNIIYTNYYIVTHLYQSRHPT
ncbi:hypothetical protein Peur_054608 [Populus x canadensis]